MPVRVQVTEYGAAALTELRQVVARAKAHDPMAPETVLVPNNIAGIVARRHLAHGIGDSGPGIAAIDVTTLARLAERVAAPRLAPRRPAARPIVAGAWRRALTESPGGFGDVASHPATVRAVASAHGQLRDLSEESLAAVEALGGVSGDVVRLHRVVQDRLADGWYDARDLLDLAAAVPLRLGGVVLYLPQRLTPPEIRFLRNLELHTDVTAVVGMTGVARADRAVVDSLAQLGVKLPAGPRPRTASRVINASDSDDEVRCIVREVVETLQVAPAHRVAVLYGSALPYARLLQEHLAAAGIAVNGTGTRPTAERAVARLLTEVLALVDRDVPRADLFRAIANAPARDFDGNLIPVSSWERISRSAGVVAGGHWETRIATYVAGEERRITEEREAADPRDSVIERSRGQVKRADALAKFAGRLRGELQAASAMSSWRDLAEWCQGLFRGLVGEGDELLRLPLEEQHAAAVVVTVLAAASSLDAVDSNAGLDGLRQLLNLELGWSIPRVGRFGEGVFVGPLSQAPGLDLDVVFVVGLAEDIFPGRLGEDALLPDRVRQATGDELPRLRERVDATHRHLLAVFSSAQQVVASFPRGDLRRSTKRLPSRFLLPTLRALAGDGTLAATRWEFGDYDGMRTSGSFAGELLTTPSLGNEQEWRVRATAARGRVDDDTVAAAVAMIHARAGSSFTRYDGNLTGEDGLPDYLVDATPVSPTALESYATCPHAFFAQRLLGVEPIEQPEDIIEISPADIGTLIHQVMDELIKQVSDHLPGHGHPWALEQRAQLVSIAERVAEEFTARGFTGHPRLWLRERHRILTDLAWILDDDDQWRSVNDARVVASEMPFGMAGEPPVEIVVPGGRILMRGSADKVDLSRDGTIFVTDIKTGSQRVFKGISQDDPVVSGTKLQLPVYAHAARVRYGSRASDVRAAYWFVRRDRGRIALELTPDLEATYAKTLSVLGRSIATGLFPLKAPEQPDYAWVQCPYCNPDGIGHADNRARWEQKRHDPALAQLVSLIDPDARQVSEVDT